MIGALEAKEDQTTVAARKVVFLAMVTLAQWASSLLCKPWGLFNAVTAKQARRCKISAHLFG